jgi:hypothetical protein
MADAKISALTALTSAADDDALAIVDTSAIETKKITKANLFAPITIDGTKVGINQASPTARLDVKNTTTAQSAVYVENLVAGHPALEIASHNAATTSDIVMNGNSVVGVDNSISFTIETGATSNYWRFMTGATSYKTGTAGATELFRVDGANTAIRPGVDNTANLGVASYRWAEIFAANATINTSDERAKQDIAALDDAERRVALAIKGLVKKFRFRDAVTAKGAAARIHVGVIAQEVAAAFQAEGLDPARYAMFCHDQWDADEDREAGDIYGIRYEELLAFVIAAI